MAGSLPPNENQTATTASDGWFRTTHWSVVLGAQADTKSSHVALATLCKTYWYPLYSFIRRSGHQPEDAQDLTQEFFARLVEKDYLKAVVQEKGKFRSFLLMALKRFLANEWDKANRLKRGGGQELLSLDAQDTESRYLVEPVEEMSPDKAFDRQWAKTLLEQVIWRLQEEFAAAGKAQQFNKIRVFLSGDKESYAEVSKAVGMTEATLRVNVHRLRQRYRELLRLEISNTVETPENIDEEIRYLFSALS
jgi:RNA polymerase sigma factor (sigma-70 family)